MANFQEVSLGFAEFVSQLIQETFDAVLSSQNYQLEKYAELQSRLSLPNSTFAALFITPEQVSTKAFLLLGKAIEEKMLVDQDLQAFLDDNVDSAVVAVDSGELTLAGVVAIQEVVIDLLVEEQKSLLNTLINQSSMANLVVDSGEITAKLELSNLYATEDNNTDSNTDGGIGKRLASPNPINPKKEGLDKVNPKLDKDPNLSSPKLTDPKFGDPTLNDPKLNDPKLPNPDNPKQPDNPKHPDPKGGGDNPEDTTSPKLPGDTILNPNLNNDLDRNTLFLPSYQQNINIVRHQDLDTGTTTIMVDKQALDQLHHSNLQIPNVRLAVKPTKLTGSSNLYSEVKINFKTV